MKNSNTVLSSILVLKGFSEIVNPGKIISQNSDLGVKMVKFFIPSVIFTHNFREKYGSCAFPAFKTLEELRKYYPEPIDCFIFHGTEQKK